MPAVPAVPASTVTVKKTVLPAANEYPFTASNQELQRFPAVPAASASTPVKKIVVPATNGYPFTASIGYPFTATNGYPFTATNGFPLTASNVFPFRATNGSPFGGGFPFYNPFVFPFGR